ncbi:MAG: hypothetical protein M3O61_01570 [Gemmatimonadota bacterium]|nr:hypothetical protein [Gemmatimonadota bacterium]
MMVVAKSRASPDVAIILPGLTDSALAATSHFELAAVVNTPLELFGSRGLTGSSMLQAISQPGNFSGCVSWPTGRLARVPASDWRVGFEEGRVVGLPLDSLEGMNSVDSSQFVGSILQAVSSLGNTGDSAFRGIPYFVRKGYRLTLPPSTILVAEAIRRINEEANPREEHVLLLAERSRDDAGYRVGFHKRSAGPEESLETSEILVAVRFTSSSRLAVVVTFDYEDGGKIGLLERVAAGNWRITWKSAYADC